MSIEHEELEKIDLIAIVQDFFKVLRRFWALALVLVIGFSGRAYVSAARSFVPMYEAKANFTVQSNYSTNDIFSTSYYYDNTAAQQLAAAFPYMLSMEVMRDTMKEQLGVSYINGSISASSVVNTNLFVLTVRSSDPQDAYDILCATIDCYPRVAVYMVDNPQITVLKEPQVPTTPYNTFQWKEPVLRGAAKGGMVAFALLLVITLLTKKVSSVDQLKKVGNRPVLAVFPLVTRKKRRFGKPVVIRPETDPAMAESLEALALKLRKSLAEDGKNIIAITSSVKGEGKTTISTNLAKVLAADGSRVVVVDADLRSQSVAARYGAKPGSMNLMASVQNERINVMDQLQYLPDSSLAFLSGRSIQVRHYSIDAVGTRRVMDTLAENFDYVVVDTPPCGMVADAALLCYLANRVLYVVKQDAVREAQIVDYVNNLYDRGAHVEGFLFNGVVRSKHYGYGYGYRYGYGRHYGSKYGGYSK